MGGNIDFLRYSVDKSLNGNPQFNYRNLQQPFEAQFGFGDPTLEISNRQYGVYGQDTWAVNPKLTVTLGLRWDYESDQLDSSYVTPPAIVAGLTGRVSSSYFSSGNDRSPYTNAWQPRLGFSYDLRGDSKSVVFGGAGRYYDRLFLNATLDERYRLQFPVYRIQFSPDGAPGTVQWNDSYLSVAGLNGLIASGRANPEIFLLNNDTKPPYSDQMNIGYRQALAGEGAIATTVCGEYRGLHGCRRPALLLAGCRFGNVSSQTPRQETRTRASSSPRPPLHRSLGAPSCGRMPRPAAGRPGSLEFPRRGLRMARGAGSERDRISQRIAACHGTWLRTRQARQRRRHQLLDFSQGFDLPARQRTHPFLRSIRPPKEWGFAERSVDFRLEKAVVVGGVSVALIGEVFNAFNWTTYGCLNNFIPPEGNPSFGQPGCVTNLGRREQVGVKIRF